MVGIGRVGWARGMAARFFGQEVEILTTTQEPDAEGNLVTVTTAVTVRGRLTERGTVPTEQPEGGRITARSVWTLYLPALTSLSATNKVVIEGKTYAVIEDDGGRSDAAVLKVYLVRTGEGE